MLTLSFSFIRVLELLKKRTFIVLVDVLDDNRFLLLFFEGVGGVGYGVGFVKCIVFFFVGMSADGAGGYFLELVPVVNNLIAAGPAFFGIVEDGLTAVVVASCI